MEEESECCCCREYFSTEMKNCSICESEVCDDCKIVNNVINFEEWISDCTNKCEKCSRIGCGNCISTCYQCWNIGEEHKFLCRDCSTLSRQNCEYHKWNLCSKHIKDKCVVCKANKNFSKKNEF